MTDAHAAIDLRTHEVGLYRDIFQNCADGIIMVDGGQRITSVNPSAETMFGYSADALTGQLIDILIPAQARKRHRALVDGFQESDVSARFMDDRGDEILGRRFDGSEFPVSISILNSGAGESVTLVAIVRDISRQKALEAELQKLAGTDPLTGILNRRSAILRAEEEMERATRYNHPLAIAMVDIDRFKTVNDSFGHLVGDRAIRHVVDTISAGLRKPDRIGRWGGEEFLLILPEIDQVSAMKALQRLRQDVGKTPLPIDAANPDDGQKITLTVSIGATGIAAEDRVLDDLIARADQALYHAKRTGRDRVCTLSDMGASADSADVA